jgi:catechol 2,3-dioxygenase-like lactoylglutathione lyase family enzyme
VQPVPLIVCSSVSNSSEWYQRVLGLTSAHGGDEYEMLLDGEHGPMVLQLHEFDAHEHPHLLREGEPLGGNGVALWFETTEFATAAERVHATGIETEVVLDVHVNPAAQHLEIWLRDPDGYLVVVSSTFGDVG